MRCLNGDFVRLRNGMPTPTGCADYLPLQKNIFPMETSMINIINVESAHFVIYAFSASNK